MFLDRDGVINDLEFNPEEGRIGSPLSEKQLRVFPYAGEAVRELKELGFKVILISNQPGVAKQQLTQPEFERMNRKIWRELAKNGGGLDAEYYCLHHPDARVRKYRVVCDCRKPLPGLILRAADAHGLDLGGSFFVGDALEDVKAGRAAGCRTVLLGHITTFLSRMIEREDAEPDFMLPSLKQVPDLLRSLKERRPVKTKSRA